MYPAQCGPTSTPRYVRAEAEGRGAWTATASPAVGQHTMKGVTRRGTLYNMYAPNFNWEHLARRRWPTKLTNKIVVIAGCLEDVRASIYPDWKPT